MAATITEKESLINKQSNLSTEEFESKMSKYMQDRQEQMAIVEKLNLENSQKEAKILNYQNRLERQEEESKRKLEDSHSQYSSAIEGFKAQSGEIDRLKTECQNLNNELTKSKLDYEKEISLLQQKYNFSSQMIEDSNKLIEKLSGEVKNKQITFQTEQELKTTIDKIQKEKENLDLKYEAK